MRVYFLSARPCALKVNGVYLGETDGFERYADLFPRDRPFVEFLPQNGFLPLSFFLSEDILDSPPFGVSVYRAPSFLILYAENFSSPSAKLELIASSPSVTVFSQGLPQALLFGKNIIDLTEAFSACKISEYGSVILLEGEGELRALYNGTEFFGGKAEEWRYDPQRKELFVKFPLCDFYGSTAECVWNCEKEGAPVLTSAKKSAGIAPIDELILCRFLQDLSAEKDVSVFLSAELNEALPQIKNYLGKYTAVFPLQTETEAGVVCPVKERVFELKYFSAELTEGRISNIRREG